MGGLAIGDGGAGSFIFAFGRSDDGLNPGGKSTVIIARLETRRNLLVNNPFAKGIGQHPFQSVADLQKHFVILNENEERRPVIFRFLTHRPRPKKPDRIIFDGGIGLHPGENRHHNLIRTLALKLFERLV